MAKAKTNVQMLKEGVAHIAKNHKFTCGNTHYRTDGSMFIFGCNVPTLSDVRMLCEDCKVPADNAFERGFGIEIMLPTDDEGYIDKKWADAPYEQPIHEFWRRLA